MRDRLVLICFAVASTATAQWLNFPTPGIPRARDGKPNLAAPPPRAGDGHPDLSGVWLHELTPIAEIKPLLGDFFDEARKLEVPGMELGDYHKYAYNILLDFKRGESPMRREAVEALHHNEVVLSDPANICDQILLGFPLAGFFSQPIKIVQSPRLSVILYERGNLHRQIYTDGRGLPRDFDLPAYLGYSVGHWEHDTLVVETAGFNDKTALDALGHPHSESLRVVERFRRRDFGHLEVEMTFDDPRMYTRPFTIKVGHDLLADSDIFESICTENERDRVHLAR